MKGIIEVKVEKPIYRSDVIETLLEENTLCWKGKDGTFFVCKIDSEERINNMVLIARKSFRNKEVKRWN